MIKSSADGSQCTLFIYGHEIRCPPDGNVLN
jgi:hypothetical protein